MMRPCFSTYCCIVASRDVTNGGVTSQMGYQMKALVPGFHLIPKPWTISQSGVVGSIFSVGGTPLPLAFLAFKNNMKFLK